ncbi:RDD family protein [Flexivirga oryzae]|uniref:Putative RDD family membrane protein YckC n=1 Tax=Flexivirga oryzae TaxID=1794944 RepID=A0A839N5A1_9MICO|nr:putative RDD family membrane protein YckC [Flexivirga oryzae]
METSRVVNDVDEGYPGAGLGMPPHGRGSLARLGPRVVAVIIDWLICSVIAAGFLGYRFGADGHSWAPLAVFFVENVLLVGTLGSTIGHRVVGLHISKTSGAPAGPGPAVLRSVLLCLFIPAIIWDKDGRGMHDRIAGTVIRRVR